jgi:ribosomal protein L12E/L44/L45/RPP1/RPP2
MGMKPSALQSAIDRNLTVKTLRQISEAARIPIAEFFFDELKSDPHWVERIIDGLTDNERQHLLAALNPSQPAAESASAEQQAASAQQAGGRQPEQEELPFDKQPSQEQQPQGTTLVGLVRCPQCGRAIRLFAEE